VAGLFRRNAADDASFGGLIFAPPGPLRPGWYRISLRNTLRTARPSVSFLALDGTTTLTVPLHYAENGTYLALYRLPEPASSLTVELGRGAPETFGERDFELFRYTSAYISGKLAMRALAYLARDPVRFALRLPEFYRAFTAPAPVALRRGIRRTGLDAYATWRDRYDFDPSRDASGLARAVAAMDDPPLVSLLMAADGTAAQGVEDTIRSIEKQIYPNWDLTVVFGRSAAGEVASWVKARAERDPRIKVTTLDGPQTAAAALDAALAATDGRWVGRIAPSDTLSADALAEMALAALDDSGPVLIYSDEDRIDADGTRHSPHFKPDFSPELLRSRNYLGGLTLIRRDAIETVGGWREGFDGAEDYDLNLRLFERSSEAGILHLPKVLYHRRESDPSAASESGREAGIRALEAHVARMGMAAEVSPASGTPFLRLKPLIADPAPRVSLLIPTRDHAGLLRQCIGSIRDKTTYDNYEILVIDNGSAEPETHAYFEELSSDDTIKVLSYPHPFNYSAINNFAVEQAGGEVVGLVNNDIEVITPDWLTEMAGWAMTAGVGCVGAKLLYPDDTIQHGGVILGYGGGAGHAHKHLKRDESGYQFRLKLVQNFSAVTAACLLVRKSLYQQVGGLDADNLPVAFNDVDFCLKLREAGYRNVWTPYAELYHHESISRGADTSPEKSRRFLSELAYLRTRWKTHSITDPYYSVHLSTTREDFAITD